jgi:hypothetical protein
MLMTPENRRPAAAHPHIRTDWPLIGATAWRAWREKVDRDQDRDQDQDQEALSNAR